jgi:hypothetical protein
MICTLLGCGLPIVLRQKHGSTDEWTIVGSAFVYGAMLGEAFQGPLLAPYRFEFLYDDFGYRAPWYLNTETGGQQRDDPRLGSLPDCWERLPDQWTWESPAYPMRFRHKGTGEVIKSDPRVLPEALQARGVELEAFSLV